jgi:hypothetical protein
MISPHSVQTVMSLFLFHLCLFSSRHDGQVTIDHWLEKFLSSLPQIGFELNDLQK